MTTCAHCGRANAPDAHFCNGCGAALARPGGEGETRKVVTVVFVDLVGSTALGERLDPEALRSVMSRYFAVAQAALERHGGTVEKFIGDAVMAVFGVPAVHEDDALRAARAAAELADDLARLNVELERAQGVRIVTRTGINTGEVVVGDGAPDQKLATGDTVNVAARLEQAAGAGEILLGERTYAAVANAVVAEAAPPVEAKGKTEPLAAWRLLGLRPDAPAFGRPVLAPFVGRDRELGELRRAFEAAVRDRSCVLATVVGTPGIGKSRLARELVRGLEREARVLVGRCAAYGEGITYLPLADAVREVAGADPEPGLARLLRGAGRGETAARLIAAAVGSDGGGGSPDETAWAFRRLFEALAEQRPLVLVVDDIHWADHALLDLLEYVSGFSSGASMLLLCLARPDLFDQRPSWAAPRRQATLVSLEPLAEGDAESLVARLAGDGALIAPLRRRIVQTAEGNPLFVEQMLAMLADDPDAADEAVPAGIHTLLAARLDRLELEERAVVQAASVEGRLFHRGVVEQLLDRPGMALGPILLSLARKEFVQPDRSLHPGDDAFRFNHVLIRDVAYASLPKAQRANLHGRLAALLDRLDGSGLAGHDEVVGYHLEQAHRYRAELGRIDDDARRDAARGGRLLAAAGLRAAGLGHAAAAAALLRRGVGLLAVEPGERAVLLPDLGRALGETGDLSAAEEALAEATGADDEAVAVRGELQRARIAFMRATGDPDELRGLARRAIQVFERIGNDADLADAWQVMGIAELAAGDRDAQLAALQRGRAHAIASGDTRRQIEAWNEVGGSMLFGRTPLAEVLAFLEEELAWAEERGIAAVEADALLAGPYLLSRLGRFDEAREWTERSKAICRELGIAYGLAEAHFAAAQMEQLAGDDAAAEAELRTAIATALAMGADRYVALYRTWLAHVLLDAGLDDAAATELELAREQNGAASRWQSAHARLLASRGDTTEAVTLARGAVASIDGTADITLRARELVALAEVLGAAGDVPAAADALTEAIALHEQKGNVLPAAHCRELLAAVEAGQPARGG